MKNPLKKVKKGSVEENATVSEGQIKIKVFMRLGSSSRSLRSEYIATEKRDDYNNLVAINETYMHNEDVDFSQEDVYSSMNITLGLDGNSQDEKLKILDDEIERYSKRIKAIDNHPELNVLANYWDETHKLKQLQVFREYTAYKSPDGSYTYNEYGRRVYEFESVGGFLIPIWKGYSNLIDYTDYTRNKKITMQETAELKTFLTAKKKQNIKYASLFIVLVINIVLAAVLCLAIVKTLGYHNDAVERWEAPALYCADQSASIVGTFTDLINNEVVKGCLLSNNQSELIEDVNGKIKALSPDK